MVSRKGRKISLVVALSALIFALATPLGAYAQVEEETIPEQEETIPEAIPQEETVAAPEQAEAEADFDQLVSSVTNINEEIAALRRGVEFDAADVQVVNVEDVLGENEEDAQAFEAAVGRTNIKIWALQNVLGRQEAISGVLESSKVPLENVVAVHMAGEGEVIVFYQSSPIASEARPLISSNMRGL